MTAIEWALTHPNEAVSVLLLTVFWLILAVPGLWLWIDKGILPMRERWRSNWRYWPRANFMESVFVTLVMALLWLAWLRAYLFLLG